MPPSFRVRIDIPGRVPGGDPSQPSPVEALAAKEGLTDKQALAAFRKAVRLEPADPDYYYILGDALAQLGRHGEALPALEEAIRLSPEDPAYRYALGATLWTMRRYEEAASAFQAARAAVGDDRVVLERLMHAVRERGLEDRLRESSFEIRTRPRWRIVRCHYDVPVDVLVGWQTSLHFSIEVEEPYVLLESP